MSIQELKDILDRGQLDARDIHSMMRLRAELDEARGLANMLTEQRDAARADNARLREALTELGQNRLHHNYECKVNFPGPIRDGDCRCVIGKALAATDSREELSKVAAESCTCCAAFTNSRSGDERDSEAELKPR